MFVSFTRIGSWRIDYLDFISCVFAKHLVEAVSVALVEPSGGVDVCGAWLELKATESEALRYAAVKHHGLIYSGTEAHERHCHAGTAN